MNSPTPPTRNTSAEKQATAIYILSQGFLFVQYDHYGTDVVIPESIRGESSCLQFGYNGMAVPIRDFVVNEHGIGGILSFGRTPFSCWIPWKAVYGLLDAIPKGYGKIWPEDIPAELKKNTAKSGVHKRVSHLQVIKGGKQ